MKIEHPNWDKLSLMSDFNVNYFWNYFYILVQKFIYILVQKENIRSSLAARNNKNSSKCAFHSTNIHIFINKSL